MGKSRAAIGWKKTNERVSLLHIFELYTNSFCREMARLEVLMKVASRADNGKKSGLGQE